MSKFDRGHTGTCHKRVARRQSVTSWRGIRLTCHRGDSWVMSEAGVFGIGVFPAEIELANGGELHLCRLGVRNMDKVKRIKVKALLGTSVRRLCIPEDIKCQLDLPVLKKEVDDIGDGLHREVEVVGPVEIWFKDCSTTVQAVVLPEGSDVLLGWVPLGNMDVVVDTGRRQLRPSPMQDIYESTFIW